MNPIKSFLALTAILCAYMLYAEDNNTYIKQQVAYKDQGASGKELTWDVLDRPLRTAWMDGTHNVYHYSIDTDAFGVKRLKQMYTDEKGYSQQQYSAPQGWVTTSILPENTVTTFVYDALGQLQQSTDPDGLTTLYQYDGLGRKISRHHPDAGMTQWSYDNLGNITSSATQRQINEGTNTIYEYDYDRLIGIHYPRHPQLDVIYEYDSVGRLAKRTDIAGYESFQYDVFGNVSETDRLFVIPTENYAYRFRTRFNYDALGRITYITYPDGEQVTYSYIAGRLSRISSGNNTYLSEIKYNPYEKPICYHFGNGYTTEYTYDSTRLWMTRQKNYNANYLLQDLRYVYDAIGNIHYIEQIADSVGWLGGEYILDYQYDSLSRLIRTDMSSHYFGNYANYNMTYSPSGLVGEKICNDMPWDYQYGYKFNSNGYLQNHQLQCIYDNITGENTALQWDANGQLLNILRPCQGDIRHHWWDEQGHLTAFVDNEHCGYYGYDGNGERVYKLTGQALLDQYNAGEPTFQMYFRDAVLYVNPYMVVTPRGYTKHYYNGNQRIAARIGKLEDLPDNIVVESDTVAVERINNARGYMTSLLNTLDMQDVDTTGIIADIAGNSISGEQCDYIQTFHTSMHCDSNILYPVLSKNSTEADVVDGMYFYHSDHLGSATWITNSAGNPVEYIHYMPYGELWVDQQATAYVERFRFTGKERDSESGYDYFGARYYSSTLPMWLSVDPLSDSYPDISPYAYCRNNPINFVDPDGKDVVAINKTAQNRILGTLSHTERMYVAFNENGKLNINQLNQCTSTSHNITALKALSQSEVTYKFLVQGTSSDGKTDMRKAGGVTEMYGAENNPSSDPMIVTIISGDHLEGEAAVRNMAHEAYGHAYMYELKNKDAHDASHHYEVDPNQSYIDDNGEYMLIYIDTNTELQKHINEAITEASKNYKDKL